MPMRISLTQGQFTVIDDADWPLVRPYKWYANRSHNKVYAHTSVPRSGGGQSVIKMHRLILGLSDPTVECDHRDGDGLNNRRKNLRTCSRAENAFNRGARAGNTTGYKGVSWDRDSGRWRAQIMKNGRTYHLGRFDSPEAAHAAYSRAAVEFHGEFANTG